MKRENKVGKKLSLKKIQITKLSFIRGGGGVGLDDNATGVDTTTSKNCDNGPVKATVSVEP
ncbi:hypothetical protein ACI513_18045 [Chryseobacterium sp. M5]|uniref:hypothetical protein n=1 Tax=Chryseobacterium sp. M5 TaxID=3379128 RepID=UPI00385797BA